MAAKQNKYGGGGKYENEPTALRSDPDRSNDFIEKDHVANEYIDTNITRWPDGSFFAHCIKKGKELWEWCHASGTGWKIGPDGSMDTHVTGNQRQSTKGGVVSNVQGNYDSKQVGQNRQNIDGGQFTTVAGDQNTYVGGNETTFSGTASSRGHFSMGKHTMYAEKGVGLGVGQGNTRKNQLFMFPDGSMRIQVQPSGQTDGAAVVDIDKDGNVKITSAKTITMESAETMKLKAKELVIDAPVTIDPTDSASTVLEMRGNFHHVGNYTQQGFHVDSRGPHVG